MRLTSGNPQRESNGSRQEDKKRDESVERRHSEDLMAAHLAEDVDYGVILM